MDLHTLAVNKDSIIAPHGKAYGTREKGGGDFLCHNRKNCGHQEPKKLELSLSFTAEQPVELHVHGFCFALDDVVIRKPNCGGVITLNGRFGLRPTHLDKGLTSLDHGFGADEEAKNFGFSSRRHNKLDYLGDSDNRDIAGRDRGFF